MLYDLLTCCIWNGSCRHATLGLYLVCSYLLDWLKLMPDVNSDAYCTTSHGNSQTSELPSPPPPNPHQSRTNMLQIIMWALFILYAIACVLCEKQDCSSIFKVWSTSCLGWGIFWASDEWNKSERDGKKSLSLSCVRCLSKWVGQLLPGEQSFTFISRSWCVIVSDIPNRAGFARA